MKNMFPTIKEINLYRFFESEHVSRAYGVDWQDSDSVYEWTDQTGVKLSFALHPIHKDCRITVSHASALLLDWHILAAADIAFDEIQDRITIIEDDRYHSTISARPNILVKRTSER